MGTSRFLLIISILLLIIGLLSLKFTVNVYNIVISTIGLLGSITQTVSYFEQKKKKSNKLRPFPPVSLSAELFTNRIEQTKKMLDLLNRNHTITSVYGNKGAGKTEFLKIITDYINNNIHKELNTFFVEHGIDRRAYRNLKKYKALYFDISDKMGMQEVIVELFSKLFSNSNTNETITYHHFLNELQIHYRNQNLVLIFDNFNNLALKQELIKILQEHQVQRSKDLFIIGSIHEFVSPNVESISYVHIEAFNDKNVIKKYASKKGLELSEDLINRAYEMSYGLPIYLSIILNDDFVSPDSKYLKSNIDEYLIGVISKLDKEVFEFSNYCAILSSSNTILKMDMFLALKFDAMRLKKYIDVLTKNSLLVDLGNKSFKMHDIISEFIIEHYVSNEKAIVEDVITYYVKLRKYKEVLICSLIAGDLSNKDLIIKVLKTEVDNDNLSYLFTLGEIIHKHQIINAFHAIDQEIYNHLLFSYLYMKMGIGDYLGAENLVDNLLRGQINLAQIPMISSDIEFEFNFLVADLLHLQNKYSDAINEFNLLLDIATKNEELSSKVPKCLWAISHSSRHQADDLVVALDYYEKCLKESLKQNDIKHICRAINGKLCINLAFDNLNYNYIHEIDKVYQYNQTNPLGKIALSTMKYHAIYLRKKRHFEESIGYLDQAYNEHKKAKRRLVADLEFEYGEHFRKLKYYEKAYNHYKKAHDSGKANNDRNLFTHAMLGIILVELISEKFFLHTDNNDIKEALIQNIRTSSEANININKIQSKIILEYLKPNSNSDSYGFDSYLQRLCLNKEHDIYTHLSKDKLIEFDLIML